MNPWTAVVLCGHLLMNLYLQPVVLAEGWDTLLKGAVVGSASKSLNVNGKTDSLSVAMNGRDQYAYYDGKVISSYPFTVGVWVKTSSASSQTPVGIFDPTSGGRFWRIRIAQGLPGIEASNPSLERASSSARIDNARWHLLVAVFASSQRRELFVDGVSQAISTQIVNFSTNASSLVVGRSGGPQPADYFNGKVNEVAVWSSALSPNAIREVYNAGKPIQIGSNSGSYTAANTLVSWWKMGDSGADNFGLHLKDARGPRHLRPYNLDSTRSPSSDVP